MATGQLWTTIEGTTLQVRLTKAAAAWSRAAILGLLGALILAAPVAADEPVASTELEVAQEEGRAHSDQRMADLRASGLSGAEAAEQLLSDQRETAGSIRMQISHLAASGLEPEEIADTIPSLVLVEESSEDVAPLSYASDINWTRHAVYYESGCSCYNLTSNWEQEKDLENGHDAVGITFGEGVYNLGGYVYRCDIYYNPDRCVGDDTSHDTSYGSAFHFNSESGERGYITASVRQYDDGPGRCQAFAYYGHAWTTVRFNGFSIGKDSLGITWDFNDNEWKNQKPQTGQVDCS